MRLGEEEIGNESAKEGGGGRRGGKRKRLSEGVSEGERYSRKSRQRK